MWYMDDLLENDSLTMRLYTGSGDNQVEICRGFMADDVEISVRHNYGNGSNDIMAKLANGVAEGKKFIENVARQIEEFADIMKGGGSLTADQKRVASRTYHTYDDFRYPFDKTDISFTTKISTYFINCGNSDNIIAGKPHSESTIAEGINELLKYTGGSMEDGFGDTGMMLAMNPPNNYYIPLNLFKQPPEGTFRMIYGKHGSVGNLKLDTVSMTVNPARGFDGEIMSVKVDLDLSVASLFMVKDVITFFN